MKQLYIISYESAHWCGGQSNCVVWANNEDEAQELAVFHMDEMMQELFSSEYEEDPELQDDIIHVVNEVQLLVDSEFEEYYADPVQRANFYPCVNPEDAV